MHSMPLATTAKTHRGNQIDFLLFLRAGQIVVVGTDNWARSIRLRRAPVTRTIPMADYGNLPATLNEVAETILDGRPFGSPPPVRLTRLPSESPNRDRIPALRAV